MKDKLETGLCMVGFLTFLYVGAYFALARHGATFTQGGRWAASPRYAVLPDPAEVCFRSLHNWDRTFLRRGFWAGTIPREEREEQLLAADAAFKAAVAAVKQPPKGSAMNGA